VIKIENKVKKIALDLQAILSVKGGPARFVAEE
jgi:hypothetical protein